MTKILVTGESWGQLWMPEHVVLSLQLLPRARPRSGGPLVSHLANPISRALTLKENK